jgi:phage protein D
MSGFTRAPRVFVNGIIPIECDVYLSSHQSANTFSAKFALDVSGSFDGETQIGVTIMGSNDGPSLTQVFTGVVDKVSVDWEARIVIIGGRDLTAGPLDQKTNEKWLNKQPIDIITDLAGRSGLGVQFSGTATDRAGLKYNQDYNRISELDSHWNVIVRLAKELGCIAYVQGSTVIVAPWNAGSGGVYPIFYQGPTPARPAQGTCLSLRTGTDLQLSKGVTVNVKSWQQKEGQSIESTHSWGGGGGIQHDLKHANLTKQQADEIAKGRLGEIISHQRTIDAVIPGDITINAQMLLSLSGTGSSADQTYVISDIRHNWAWSTGFKTSLRGRNSNKGGSET